MLGWDFVTTFSGLYWGGYMMMDGNEVDGNEIYGMIDVPFHRGDGKKINEKV